MVELEPCQLVVCQRVARIVPSTKTKIHTADESHHVVHNHQFLVMGPEELILSKLIRTALNANVLVEIEKTPLSIFRVDGNGRLDVPVHNHKYLDAFLSLPLE